ncbi:NDR1/HIN1-like protein [Tenacibaculum retecalamus]|uniref:NDR1/HIN1-like protein n=1 Tax=Tenacibaculum retecalamus TaxID=3018315 RepID=UPI0023D8E80A|nr:LEA type 2 family protein [Tenacibaculum retecalamus]WBX72435.1 LEA type 2 family protein [Tenacibaculum retecalamus]
MSIASDTIRLKATAFFKNPNDIGGKLATDEIKVIVNGEEVAQVSSDEFEVPARKEFNIPLKVVIPAKKIFGDTKNGILGGLINSILTKSIKVQFKGDLKYRVLGFSDVYPIDKTEDIKNKILVVFEARKLHTTLFTISQKWYWYCASKSVSWSCYCL